MNTILDGIAMADANANEDWKTFTLAVVKRIAQLQPSLVVWDVRDYISAIPNGPTTHNLSALGPVLLRASKLGYIEKTDNWLYPPSGYPQAHCAKRVWKSLLFDWS